MNPAEGAACLIIAVSSGSADARGCCSAAVVMVAALDWTALAAVEPMVGDDRNTSTDGIGSVRVY
jgi:hypothetical protein